MNTVPLGSALLLGALFLSGCDELGSKDEGSSSAADDLAIWSSPPDVGACVPGTLTTEYQKRILGRVNQLRLLHELPAVRLAPAEAAPAQAAALVAVANAKLAHSPSPSAFCYSEAAAESSSESLLFLSAGNQVGNVRDPDRFLADWLRDVDVGSLGHRRWLLDPFVSEMAFGLVQGKPHVDFPFLPVVGAALHVVDDADADLAWWPSDFVAYPFGIYPGSFVEKSWLFSFSAVADKSKRLGSVGRVSFDAVSVQVRDQSGAPLSVHDVSGAYDLTGLPNVLTWQTDGLSDGVSYTVTISGATIDDEPRDYEYGFTLMP